MSLLVEDLVKVMQSERLAAARRARLRREASRAGKARPGAWRPTPARRHLLGGSG